MGIARVKLSHSITSANLLAISLILTNEAAPRHDQICRKSGCSEKAAAFNADARGICRILNGDGFENIEDNIQRLSF